MNIFNVQLILLTIAFCCHFGHQGDYLAIWRCYSCYPNNSNETVNCHRSNEFRKSPSVSCLKMWSKLYPWARCKSHFTIEVNGIQKIMERICLYKPSFTSYYPDGCIKRDVVNRQKSGKVFELLICDCDSYYCSRSAICSPRDSYMTLIFVAIFNLIYLLSVINCAQY